MFRKLGVRNNAQGKTQTEKHPNEKVEMKTPPLNNVNLTEYFFELLSFLN